MVIFTQLLRAFLWLSCSSMAFGLSFERVFAPQDVREQFVQCPLSEKDDTGVLFGKLHKWQPPSYYSYQSPDWWLKTKDSLMQGLPLPKQVYATVIDVRRLKQGGLGFLYLSNGSYDERVQPWSSSKWMAAALAMMRLRQEGMSGDSEVFGMRFGDLISTAHHGFPTKTVRGPSNEIGTLFQNIATRTASNAFVKTTLQRPADSFGGAYGRNLRDGPVAVFDPHSGVRKTIQQSAAQATGTRLSTLTMAEALKRLTYFDDPAAPLPHLKEEDIRTLFYGAYDDLGGMLIGIDGYLRQAFLSKQRLDGKTGGRWRIFGKMGAAMLHTGNEQIVNGLVCLPQVDGGRAFILSVHAFGRVGHEGDRALQEAVNVIIRGLVPSYFE